jgi:dynein light chain roadblock-type
VRGVMILARASAATSSSGSSGSLGSSGSGIVQSTGAVFEGEGGRRYAGALEAVVNATAGAVAACDEGVSEVMRGGGGEEGGEEGGGGGDADGLG